MGPRFPVLALIGLFGLALGCGGPEAAIDARADEARDGGADAATDSGPDASVVAACFDSFVELMVIDPAVAPAAGSVDYVVPTATALEEAEDAFAALAAGDPGAPALLEGIGYQVCRIGMVTVAWPGDASAGGPRLAVRRGDGAAVVLEAPHPLFDSDTDDQAAAMFERLDARALLVAGTHRCANPDQPAGCDGTTSVCGASEYPISDQAHTEESLFHRAHVALDRELDPDLVVSVHGMKAAGARLSDGTTGAVTASSSVAEITTALAAAFPGEAIESCNPFPGAAVTDTLCGTTNVQGRHVNGSSAPCTDGAGSASGRFLHLEQSSGVRAQPDLVAGAIAAGL